MKAFDTNLSPEAIRVAESLSRLGTKLMAAPFGVILLFLTLESQNHLGTLLFGFFAIICNLALTYITEKNFRHKWVSPYLLLGPIRTSLNVGVTITLMLLNPKTHFGWIIVAPMFVYLPVMHAKKTSLWLFPLLILGLTGFNFFLSGNAESFRVSIVLLSSIAYLAFHVMDVLKQALIQSESTTTAKSQFLANMSHELRTPLNGIVGMVDILGSTNLDANQSKIVSSLKISSDHLREIAGGILDFSKIEAGRLSLNEETFKVNDLMVETIESFRAMAIKKGLELSSDIQAELAIRSDRSRLKQILSNLLSNAVKYSEFGTIHIECKVTPDSIKDFWRVTVTVADRGIGIKPVDQSRLFKEFEQFSGASNTIEGTGLGLSICKKLVQLMGGDISYRPNTPTGSIFEFYIVGEKTIIRNPEASRPMIDRQYSLKGIKVLIAEDNEINLEVITYVLSTFGCEYEVATDGKKAVDLAIQGAFDLILMDVQMPEMNGLEATKLILNSSMASPKPPVIGLTATTTREIQEKAHEVGMVDLLFKPVEIEKLRVLMYRHLSQSIRSKAI